MKHRRTRHQTTTNPRQSMANIPSILAYTKCSLAPIRRRIPTILFHLGTSGCTDGRRNTLICPGNCRLNSSGYCSSHETRSFIFATSTVLSAGSLC
jgi:hypothetical protein